MMDLIRSQTLWTAVGALATIAGVFAIFLAWTQLRFQAWLKAQELWNEPDFLKAREVVLNQYPRPHDGWPANGDEEKAALLVCRRMDEFAWLIPHVPQDKMLRVWGDPFGKAWVVLKGVVERENNKCARRTKWQAFKRLGEIAAKDYLEQPTFQP